MTNILLGGLIVLLFELWMAVGFVLLMLDNPKLNNGLESIARIIAWPCFLWGVWK